MRSVDGRSRGCIGYHQSQKGDGGISKGCMLTSEIFALSLATCASLAATNCWTRDKGFLGASLFTTIASATLEIPPVGTVEVMGRLMGAVAVGAVVGAVVTMGMLTLIGVGVAVGGWSFSLVTPSTGIPTSALSIGRVGGRSTGLGLRTGLGPGGMTTCVDGDGTGVEAVSIWVFK